MRRTFALPLLAAGLLAGCASLEYQSTDSFEQTLAFAQAGVPAAELQVARMYADPGAYPQSRGRAANPVQAAKWCYVLADGPVPPASPGPSCADILARIPTPARDSGLSLAQAWLAGPEDYIEE